MARRRHNSIAWENMHVVIAQIMRPASDADVPHEWPDEAACRDSDPEIFYPAPVDDRWDELSGTADPSIIKVAKLICNGDPAIARPPCPVRTQCLGYAMRHEKYGIWGGLTAQERAELRPRRHDG